MASFKDKFLRDLEDLSDEEEVKKEDKVAKVKRILKGTGKMISFGSDDDMLCSEDRENLECDVKS